MRRHKGIVPKIFLITAIPLLSLCATFILLTFLTPHKDNVPVITIEMPSVAPQSVSSALIPPPVQVKIETINVLALIIPVGLNAQGDMAIDENPEQAAWYKLGPKPGEEGSAVIAGHYGWKDGVPSVFSELHTLMKGDKISTVNEKGEILTFVVTRLAIYTPNQDATDVFKSDDGKAHLNLVTCQGSWNKSESTYSERLIVFTDLAD